MEDGCIEALGRDRGRECERLRPTQGHWAGQGRGKSDRPAVFGASKAL